MEILRPLAGTRRDLARLHGIAVACLLLATSVSAASKPRGEPMARVRPSTGEARLILDEGLRRSPTIRRLMAELQRHDVIAYVELDNTPGGRRGATSFMNATTFARMVRIVVNRDLGPRERIEVFGHELHHALEIARAPDVVDASTWRRFFGRVGYLTKPSVYETDAALRIEEEVRCDLSR